MRGLFSWETKRKVGKIVAFAIFLSLNLGWVGSVSSGPAEKDDVVWRAPREDAPASSCVDCSGGSSTQPELDSIRRCVCFIREIWGVLPDNATVADYLILILEIVENLNISINIIDSKIDVLDDNIDSMLDCCETVDSKIDEIFIDFQETWTILGDYTEVAVGGLDTLSQVNTSTLSVIAWLKTIFAESKGLV